MQIRIPIEDGFEIRLERNPGRDQGVGVQYFLVMTVIHSDDVLGDMSFTPSQVQQLIRGLDILS